MNSLGKYVLTKTQKIVLLVVVFALIAGGYYAGFYLPVQRRIEAADTAELEPDQLEQMESDAGRQMEERSRKTRHRMRRWFRPTIISRQRRRN